MMKMNGLLKQVLEKWIGVTSESWARLFLKVGGLKINAKARKTWVKDKRSSFDKNGF